MRNISLISLLVLALLAAAFMWSISGRGLLFLTTVLKVSNPISTVDNISCGPQAWQKLDVCSQDVAAPVVVFIHGGSWLHGRYQ